MQSRTHTLIFRKTRDPILVELFAYSSKGMGGINVIGFGKYGNTLKEKIIFLCKEKGLKLPFKRYVLCIENSDFLKDLEFNELRWLELPLFLLLLHISGHLKICNLQSCLASGKINMNFTLIIPYIEKEKWQALAKKWEVDALTYIGEFLEDKTSNQPADYISIRQVLEGISTCNSGFEKIYYS